MTSLTKVFPKEQLSKIAALLLLILLLAGAAVPGYITGKWQWKQPPAIAHLQKLKDIRKVGLTLPDWKNVEQNEQQIGERKWSVQVIEKAGERTQALLLLLPQNGPSDQPEIEWTDVDTWSKIRWNKWDIAQATNKVFTVKQPTTGNSTSELKIEARYFRGTTTQQTFAVMQWYALPNGGHTSPFRWFVADQLAQWHKKRVPWVAVSILMPIEPLGNVENYWSTVQSLAEKVQSALLTIPLQT
ncbi:MAG TPA: cyanoexosortase B system-associated protein [Nostocaceae cyanobacterium]|nr:cyanoexosortase B system-associated protein [Nostocaceae cyanobacterium]